MALGARELILILRATNQASGPIRQVSRDLRTLGSGTTAAGHGVDQLASKRRWAQLGAASAILKDTGRSARIMGIAVGAGLGFAASSAAKFQTQVGLVATQTGDLNLSIGRTTEQMQKNAKVIETGVLAQMNKFPASAEEMNDALYEIYSSTELGSQGLKGVNNGLKFLTLMNKAAVAGQTDLSEVTKAATSVMNAFGGGVKGMPQKLERMFAAVRFGRMTFADFTNTFSQIVPATQAAGQSFDTMTGTMAALTRLMPNVRVSATAYARMLEIFGRKKFVEGAKKFGVEMQDAKGNLRPLPQIIDDFRVAINKLPLKEQAPMIRNFFKELSNQEGTIQARRAFTALIKHPGLYRKVLGQTVSDNNEFTKSFRLMADTAGVKWETFMSKMRATWIKLGAAAIPILLQLLEPIQRLAEWFIKLDKETQKQIVSWAAMGAVIAIVGGTLASLVGNFGMIFAALKAGGMSFTVLLGVLGLVSAAFLLLIGQGDLLKAAFDNIFEFATQDVMHMVAALGLLYIAMTRLSFAAQGMMAIPLFGGARGSIRGAGSKWVTEFRSVQNGAKASTAAIAAMDAAAVGAMATDRRRLAMDRAFGTTRGPVRTTAGAAKAAAEAAKVSRAAVISRTMWAATVASVAVLPGPLKVAAGLTAVAAGAAFLWSRHQAKVAEEAERAAKFTAQVKRPIEAAGRTAAFGINVRELKSAQLSLRQVNLNIKTYKEQLKGATGLEREQLKISLAQAYIERAVALATVSSAQQRAMKSSQAVSTAIYNQVRNLELVRKKRQEIQQLTREMNVPGRGQDDVRLYQEKIEKLRTEINRLTAAGVYAGQALQRGVGQSLRELERSNIIKYPQRIFGQLRASAAQFATQTGRMPTIPEMQMMIKAILDPGSLKNMPAQIQQAIGIVKVRAEVVKAKGGVRDEQRDVQEAARHGGERGGGANIIKQQIQLRGASDALRTAKTKADEIKKVFGKTVTKTIKVRMQPAKTFNLGLQAALGIARGIEAGTDDIARAAAAASAAAVISGGKELETGSPSRKTERLIGKPFVQGIVMGLIRNSKQASDAAVFVIDQMEGKTVAKMTSFLQKQAQLFQKMNANLSALVRRGVPLQLVEQLAQMGAEGAKQIAKLTTATKPELNKFVAAWRHAQGQVLASGKFNWTKYIETVNAAAQKLLDIYNEMRDNLRSFLMSALQDTTRLGQEIGDTIAGAVGGLFQGPMNISEHIGKAFDEAQASYSSSMAGLQKQMEELQQRQADTIADFMERRRDELRSAFGKLFAGPILSAGFAAGSVKDLIADLNKQLKDFQDWRKNLDALSARGVPAALMRSLEELGPEASHNMALLVNATDADLAEWVAAWKAGEGAIEEVTQATYMNMEGFAEAMADIAEQMAEVARQMAELKAPKRADFAMLLADLNAQKLAWADYNSILTSLHQKGVPALLIKDLAAMGIEGVEILRILNSGTKEELDAYIASWLGLQGELDTAKKGWLAAISPEEILKGLQDTTTALTEWGDDLAFLAASGMDPAILAELKKLGPEAAMLIDGIAKGIEADPEFLAKFEGLWTTAQDNIDADCEDLGQ